jgi:hypothetical protein
LSWYGSRTVSAFAAAVGAVSKVTFPVDGSYVPVKVATSTGALVLTRVEVDVG